MNPKPASSNDQVATDLAPDFSIDGNIGSGSRISFPLNLTANGVLKESIGRLMLSGKSKANFSL